MRWTKRTAALLASLLLLSTVVQAREPAKAHAREPQNTVSPEMEKMPELIVISPETEELSGSAADTQQAAKTPGSFVVIPEPAEEPVPAVPEAAAPSAGQPESGEAEPPSFPEGEDWQLLLVNPWNEMPEDYEVHLKAMPDGMQVDEKAYDDLTAMLNACREAGLAPKICSAYRTMSKQTYLYNNKIARLQNAGYSKAAAIEEAGRWVARPGTSEHQLGLAVDIVSASYQALTKKQEQTKEQKWLMEHCWEYGFILRYPNDKSEITGIGYEPWHYRYVGVEIAQDIRRSGLCMEEYLLLREEALAARDAA